MCWGVINLIAGVLYIHLVSLKVTKSRMSMFNIRSLDPGTYTNMYMWIYINIYTIYGKFKNSQIYFQLATLEGISSKYMNLSNSEGKRDGDLKANNPIFRYPNISKVIPNSGETCAFGNDLNVNPWELCGSSFSEAFFWFILGICQKCRPRAHLSFLLESCLLLIDFQCGD